MQEFRGDILVQDEMCLKLPQFKSFGSVLSREADGRDLPPDMEPSLDPSSPLRGFLLDFLVFFTCETGICVYVCVFMCTCVCMPVEAWC